MQSGVTLMRREADGGGGERFVALRRTLGVSSFGLNRLRFAPGERGRIHRHERQEEVYLVLEGVLTLVVPGAEHDLAAGELARVGPELRRQLVNRGPAACVVLAMGAAQPHQGRDGVAFHRFDDPEAAGASPQDVPPPEDLPPAERR